jgi:urease alpha subunit
MLQVLGAFSMISWVSLALGRVGDVITGSWLRAHKMLVLGGALAVDSERLDNFRALGYLA